MLRHLHQNPKPLSSSQAKCNQLKAGPLNSEQGAALAWRLVVEDGHWWVSSSVIGPGRHNSSPCVAMWTQGRLHNVPP